MTLSKTVVLHLGHLGSSSDRMMYIRHRGQPTRTMDVASGLVQFSSDDTHELGDTVSDRGWDSTLRFSNGLGGDELKLRSNFASFTLLMVVPGKNFSALFE